MDIGDFFTEYATEASCTAFFKNKKEQSGLVCSNCGSLVHYWIDKERRWKCQGCGRSFI